MKKALFLLLGATFLMAVLAGCPGKTPPPPPEEPTPVVQDTTPEPPPPPPPPPPELKESQLETVYFDFDKFNLRPDAMTSLDKNYEKLVEFPNAMLMLEGHCDERGTVEYNIALGEKRANAVKKYLVDRGINAARLSTISYGEERPADNGHTEAAWAKNRRVEFRIISQ